VVLDHRVYRAAFLPALVALFVLAFSLTDVPKPHTTRLAPLAFDAPRAFSTMENLAERYPQRRPGSTDDTGLADRVAQGIEATGFAKSSGVQRRAVSANSIDGDTDIESIVATREGLSNHTIVVIAHRDAAGAPATADLSGTAALLELARLFADRDLPKTVVLASVSGGSGGFAGAREVADGMPGPVDAVYVLGDLAGDELRRPFVVPWSNASGAVPLAVERTAQTALRAELGQSPGRTRAVVQLLRRALPLTTGEQGAVNAAGLPAVLISTTSERRPPAGEPASQKRFATFGRGVLRTLYASLEAGNRDPFPAADGIVALKRLVPTWSIRLLVLALLAPALLTAFDGFFRARRRGAPVAAWMRWALSFALPVALAWGFARVLGATGAVVVLGAPVANGGLDIETVGWVSLAATLLIGAGTAYAVRPLLVRDLGAAARGPGLAAGGAAAASGLMLGVLVLVVWIANPYAAAVLLPAAHAWLLVAAPGRRLSRGAVTGTLAVGLAAPVILVLYYAYAWGLGPADALWTAFGLVAGGALGWQAAFTVSVFAAAVCATISILRVRRALADTPSVDDDDRVVTRGPRTYAGPGSLGGTESALRR
jgi:hypothetical protein